MTVQPHPEVPLPPGAETGDPWSNWDDELRVISTADHNIPGTDALIYASAIQFRDGTIDDGSFDEAPQVWFFDTGFTAETARQLARVVSQLADIVDRWVGVQRVAAHDALDDLMTRVDQTHATLREHAAATTTNEDFAAYSEAAARVITAKMALADAVTALSEVAR